MAALDVPQNAVSGESLRDYFGDCDLPRFQSVMMRALGFGAVAPDAMQAAIEDKRRSIRIGLRLARVSVDDQTVDQLLANPAEKTGKYKLILEILGHLRTAAAALEDETLLFHLCHALWKMRMMGFDSTKLFPSLSDGVEHLVELNYQRTRLSRLHGELSAVSDSGITIDRENPTAPAMWLAHIPVIDEAINAVRELRYHERQKEFIVPLSGYPDVIALQQSVAAIALYHGFIRLLASRTRLNCNGSGIEPATVTLPSDEFEQLLHAAGSCGMKFEDFVAMHLWQCFVTTLASGEALDDAVSAKYLLLMSKHYAPYDGQRSDADIRFEAQRAYFLLQHGLPIRERLFLRTRNSIDWQALPPQIDI